MRGFVDFMAGDPDAVVEPWTPKVGDLVRVRLSAECTSPAHNDEFMEREAEDGATGRVVPAEEQELMLYPGHEVVVMWDTHVKTPSGITVMGGIYAACELEPLEPLP